MVSEPDAKDINRLDLPGEFFELLDQNGQIFSGRRISRGQ